MTPRRARPPVLFIPGREHPHEVTLLIMAAMLGTAYVVAAPPPASMAGLVPEPWRYLWAAGLGIGGFLGLTGCFWLTDVERGLEMERAGLVSVTGGLLLYVVAVIGFMGWGGTMAAGICVAWGAANVVRARGITKDLQAIRRHLEDR